MSTVHKFVTFGTYTYGTQWRWVNYYSTEASFTPSQTQMTAWMNTVWNTIKAVLSTDCKVYGIGYAGATIGLPLTDPKVWGATTVYPMNVTGQDSGDFTPSQTALVLIGRTSVKHVIGRKFIVGLTETGIQYALPTSTVQTAALNLGGIMYASTYSMDGTALTPGVWGTKHGFTPTQSVTLSQYLGTQRRRKPGIGI